MKTRISSLTVLALIVGLSVLVSGPAFGFLTATMQLGDYVWIDTNENGIQDETGTGVAGVTVDLYKHLGDSTGEFVETTTTGADGYYYFTVVADDYYLVFTLPTGYQWTTQGPVNAIDEDDSDVDGSGTTDIFTMSVDVPTGLGIDDLTRDAGLVEAELTNPGVGTPGYWKNHPDAWPVDEITIGGITYSKADAITNMKKATKKDMTTIMFMHLVAAKLNVMIGNSDLIIGEYIVAADIWMREHPYGSKVTASSGAWAQGEPFKDMLDAYNNGLLDAPARD